MPADPIEPDTKDWTWVLERPCPQCGFDASSVDPTMVAGSIRGNADSIAHALERDTARRRPAPGVWSPAEYACHVRDVHRVFARRVWLMLDEDDPEFENWDQDAAAVESHYAGQAPAQVARELLHAAAVVADLYDAVPPDAWDRTGRRSNGSVFTIGSLARYHLHDVVHHLWDIQQGATDG